MKHTTKRHKSVNWEIIEYQNMEILSDSRAASIAHTTRSSFNVAAMWYLNMQGGQLWGSTTRERECLKMDFQKPTAMKPLWCITDKTDTLLMYTSCGLKNEVVGEGNSMNQCNVINIFNQSLDFYCLKRSTWAWNMMLLHSPEAKSEGSIDGLVDSPLYSSH